MEPQKALYSNTDPEKGERTWSNHANIKLLCVAIAIKPALQWHKNGHIDQYTMRESPERNSYFYSQLIFHRGSKDIQWTKDSLFIKWSWENWTGTCRKMKLNCLLTPQRRINSKQIKDLNIRPQTVNILEENVDSKISDIAHKIFYWIYLPWQGKQKKK